ncbi:hypothetical protein PROFUN_12031 [Planoprotostelium fungivorum]|uniref:Uncharacterized protein n=1 Tax=Planoprotostelium fungivorum TaxID=1890364 RepID=A0A2P6MRF3_9EUKA|nr:hypothetical protein PROFUN_12031 [Planoprotostelium fungivorum]
MRLLGIYNTRRELSRHFKIMYQKKLTSSARDDSQSLNYSPGGRYHYLVGKSSAPILWCCRVMKHYKTGQKNLKLLAKRQAI